MKILTAGDEKGMDIDIDSGENVDGFVVTDKDGNEAVIDSVTQMEKLKTLDPEELVNASNFMAETVKSLGVDATPKLLQK